MTESKYAVDDIRSLVNQLLQTESKPMIVSNLITDANNKVVQTKPCTAIAQSCDSTPKVSDSVLNASESAQAINIALASSIEKVHSLKCKLSNRLYEPVMTAGSENLKTTIELPYGLIKRLAFQMDLLKYLHAQLDVIDAMI